VGIEVAKQTLLMFGILIMTGCGTRTTVPTENVRVTGCKVTFFPETKATIEDWESVYTFRGEHIEIKASNLDDDSTCLVPLGTVANFQTGTVYLETKDPAHLMKVIEQKEIR
jgi:hypothetical protein